MIYFAVFVCCLFASSALAFEDKTVAQYLKDNAEFSTLYSLLNSSGLAKDLDGAGPFTLFAPTNTAFGLLNPALVTSITSDALKLQTVLKYHVLDGFLLAPQIQNGMVKTTLDGQTVQFQVFGNRTTKVQGATISRGDQIVNNGVVHVIDNVLLPSISTLAEILLSRPNDFGDIVLLLTITDLLPALSAPGPYTVFAPTNAAFEKIVSQLPSFSSPNALQFYGALAQAHVLNGTLLSTALKDGATVTTLHGNTVTVDLTSGVTLNPYGANVVIPDLKGINGVIHAIDNIMIPADLIAASG